MWRLLGTLARPLQLLGLTWLWFFLALTILTICGIIYQILFEHTEVSAKNALNAILIPFLISAPGYLVSLLGGYVRSRATLYPNHKVDAILEKIHRSIVATVYALGGILCFFFVGYGLYYMQVGAERTRSITILSLIGSVLLRAAYLSWKGRIFSWKQAGITPAYFKQMSDKVYIRTKRDALWYVVIVGTVALLSYLATLA